MGYFLGVDIGTTYTAAAVVQSGHAEIVTLGNRTPTVPTVVYLGPDDQLLVGEAANRRAITDPERVSRQFKRRIGDPTPVVVGGAPMSPQALMARVLRWVIETVTEREGGPPDHVALTHPANWGRYKIELVEQALRLSDLDQWTTLTEPEAAAIYYSSIARLAPDDVVAVYDLGGGTFDAAILRQTATGFDLLGEPEGVEHLGGIDIDEAIYAHVIGNLPGFDSLDPDDTSVLAAVARLRQDCTEAKEALSADIECTIPVLIPGIHAEVTITRDELERMLQPWLGDTIGALRRALRSASVEPSELAAVLLVGGSSRIPMVAELVGAELGRPVAVDAHPKHAIALGAAVAAHGIAGADVRTSVGPDVDVATPPPTPSAAEAGRGIVDPTPAPAIEPEPSVAAAAATPEPPPSEPPPSEPAPRSEPVPSEPVSQSGPVPSEPGASEPVASSAGGDGPPSSATLVHRQPPPDDGGGSGDDAGSARRRGILAAAVALVVALAVGAGVLLAGGGDGDEDVETAMTDEDDEMDEATDTSSIVSIGVDSDADDEMAGEPRVERGDGGRGVRIDEVVIEDDRYVVYYRTVGFDPLIDESDPNAHHIHFFFDTVAPENAGTNGPSPGQWILWDAGSPFDQYHLSDRPEMAGEMCALVADYRHGVQLDPLTCFPLPDVNR